jgi:hypothetical protein
MSFFSTFFYLAYYKIASVSAIFISLFPVHSLDLLKRYLRKNKRERYKRACYAKQRFVFLVLVCSEKREKKGKEPGR